MPIVPTTKTDDRRNAILDAAFSELSAHGYRGATMLAIARRAGASKETLYSWFGDKRGLFGELVSRQADRLNETLDQHLHEPDAEMSPALVGFTTELLRLLLSDISVALNRAAIAEVAEDGSLAHVLSERGRNAALPKVRAYLEHQRQAGRLAFESSESAADALIGLAIADLQVRRLLGAVPNPDAEMLDARVALAVDRFLRLFSVTTTRTDPAQIG